MDKKVFDQKVSQVPIWLLDTVIIIGIAAMAILIPVMSQMGKEKEREVVSIEEDSEEVFCGESEDIPSEK